MFIEIDAKVPNTSKYETLLLNTEEIYLVKAHQNNDEPEAKTYIAFKQKGFVYCRSHTYEELKNLIKL